VVLGFKFACNSFKNFLINKEITVYYASFKFAIVVKMYHTALLQSQCCENSSLDI